MTIWMNDTKNVLPFFCGYVLVPNVFFLCNRSASSPLIPLSVSVFNAFASPLTYSTKELSTTCSMIYKLLKYS